MAKACARKTQFDKNMTILAVLITKSLADSHPNPIKKTSAHPLVGRSLGDIP
jgi:hypothetical protein